MTTMTLPTHTIGTTDLASLLGCSRQWVSMQCRSGKLLYSRKEAMGGGKFLYRFTPRTVKAIFASKGISLGH